MSESASEIYVVDDDLSVRESVGRLIRSAGLNVKTFPTAQEILANLERELPSCLVLDIQLPDLDGFELQDQLARRDIQIPIIFLTGHGDIPMSVRAIKAGAVNFLTKPFNDEYFLEAIRDAIGRRNENGKNVRASNEIIGQSGAYRRIIRQVETVAPTDATVLILGETGTGKELVAREIHRRSRRKDKPLVRVNCTSIPKELFESEFFGHARGAFTGAIKDRAGRFEAAKGGTLFLKMVPLRERREDIPLLATHFVELIVKELGCPNPRLTRAGIETLQSYDWPGNIRELRNIIERAVIIARGSALEFDLPVTGSPVDLAFFNSPNADGPEPEYITESEMRRRERENILAILQKTSWKIKGMGGAAELWG
jgi:DNA-binding NtrC family response regulator